MPRHARVLLAAMLLAALVYVPLDWSRLATHAYRLTGASNALKLLSSLLAATIAWTIPRGRELEPGDARRFAAMFGVVVVADTLFMVHLEPLGVLLFLGFHGSLCVRNLRGLREARATHRLPVRRVVAASLGLVLVTATYLFWLLPQVKDPVLRVGIPVYVCFVVASVLAAVTSRWLGHFPRESCDAMALGMVLFFACDLTVGCNLVWPPDGAAQVWSSSLTWMLYAPALALIATSGYARTLGLRTPRYRSADVAV